MLRCFSRAGSARRPALASLSRAVTRGVVSSSYARTGAASHQGRHHPHQRRFSPLSKPQRGRAVQVDELPTAETRNASPAPSFREGDSPAAPPHAGAPATRVSSESVSVSSSSSLDSPASPAHRHPDHQHRRPSSSPSQRDRAAPTAQLLQSLEARGSPYASTLRKRVFPRHAGPNSATPDGVVSSAHSTDEERQAAAALRAYEERSTAQRGYDPALVLRVDSRSRQVRLNEVQRELLWSARRAQYQDLLQRVVACLQSHRSPVEKCQTLFALHDEAVRKRLRLRADTYEDIFHTFYGVGVRRGGGAGQPGQTPLSPSAQLTGGDASWDRDVSGLETSVSRCGSLPVELGTVDAVSSTVLSAHGVEHVWEMYRYLVDSGTDPSPRTFQYVMGLLEHASVALALARSPLSRAGSSSLPVSDADDSRAPHRRRGRRAGLSLVEAKAHSLMMDIDRFHLTPTEYTINSYIAVCEACDVMHLAVARVTDYHARQERQPTPGVYARLLTGLVRCGHYDDAIAVVTTMQNVGMTTYLLNAVLQAARHSRDPRSAFTFYRATFFAPARPLQRSAERSDDTRRSAPRHNAATRQGSPARRMAAGLTPSLVTFSILAEVMQETHDYAELSFLLAEMRHYRVKGNGMLLNKLLRMMQAARRPAAEVQALRSTMVAKQVRVFDENKADAAVQQLAGADQRFLAAQLD